MAMSARRTSGCQRVRTTRASAAEALVRTSAPALDSSTLRTSRVSPSSSTISTRAPSSAEEGATASSGFAGSIRALAGSAAARPGSCSGSVTVKVAPPISPGLSTFRVPPCSSIRWRTMSSPSPSPPCARVGLASACRKRSNACGRNSGEMPGPLSLTVRSAADSARCRRTWTRPPAGVNLIALVSRFQTTCCSRLGSPWTSPASESMVVRSRMSRAVAAGRTASTAPWMTGTRPIGRTSRRSWPRMARDTSSRSSMMCRSERMLFSMMSRARSAAGAASPPRRRVPLPGGTLGSDLRRAVGVVRVHRMAALQLPRQRFLRRHHVRDRDPAHLALLAEHVDHAPVAELRHRQPGEVAQRRLVVEGGGEEGAHVGEEAAASLLGLGASAGTTLLLVEAGVLDAEPDPVGHHLEQLRIFLAEVARLEGAHVKHADPPPLEENGDAEQRPDAALPEPGVRQLGPDDELDHHRPVLRRHTPDDARA